MRLPAIIRQQRPMDLIAAVFVIIVASVYPVEAAWLTSPAGKRVFVRGVVYSPYHPQQGADIDASLVNADLRKLRGLGVNCVVTEHPLGYKQISDWHERGVDTLRRVQYSPPIMSQFADGTEAPVPVYVNSENQRGLYAAARDLASALKGNDGVLGISLGNDYSWSALNPNSGGFAYAGFDSETRTAFAEYLKQRFTSLQSLNDHIDTEYRAFSEVRPPSGLVPSIIFGEWWMFMRRVFSRYLKRGHDGVGAVGAQIPITYQRPCGVQWDPASEQSPLLFNDFVSGNVFYSQSTDWSDFCLTIDRLVSVAHGRPVLISETGAQSIVDRNTDPGRIIRQSVACALMHPELAGVCLYEYCDDWRRAGDPDTQNRNNAREHWGIFDAYRHPKSHYPAARQALRMIEQNEELFQRWQSPPQVLVSRQPVDWWKVRGSRARRYKRVAMQLYQLGVSFRLADMRTLLNLNPRRHPRLIVCDSYLFNNPDSSRDVQSKLVNYVRRGGQLLYISSTPWRKLYGEPKVPARLQPPADDSPFRRDFGDGRITMVPFPEITNNQLHHFLVEFLQEPLNQRPVTDVQAENASAVILWRLFDGGHKKWLYIVNVSDEPVDNIQLHVNKNAKLDQLRIHSSDAGGFRRTADGARLFHLKTYALIAVQQ